MQVLPDTITIEALIFPLSAELIFAPNEKLFIFIRNFGSDGEVFSPVSNEAW